MAAKQKQRKKVIGGVRTMLLIPVMILGFVLVFSNILVFSFLYLNLYLSKTKFLNIYHLYFFV